MTKINAFKDVAHTFRTQITTTGQTSGIISTSFVVNGQAKKVEEQINPALLNDPMQIFKSHLNSVHSTLTNGQMTFEQDDIISSINNTQMVQPDPSIMTAANQNNAQPPPAQPNPPMPDTGMNTTRPTAFNPWAKYKNR